MKCPKCGKEWDEKNDSYDFCPFCSASLSGVELVIMSAPDALRKMVQDNTETIYKNPNRIKSMLSDYAPGDEKVRKEINSILSLGGGTVFLDLLKKHGSDTDAIKKRFIQKMTDEGLSQATCKKVINILVFSVAPEGTIYFEEEEEEPAESSTSSDTKTQNEKKESSASSSSKKKEDDSAKARKALQKDYNDILSLTKDFDIKDPPKYAELVGGETRFDLDGYWKKLDAIVTKSKEFIAEADKYDKNNSDYSFVREKQIISEKLRLFSKRHNDWRSFNEVSDIITFAAKHDGSDDIDWNKVDIGDLENYADEFEKKRKTVALFDSDGRAEAILGRVNGFVEEKKKQEEARKRNGKIITLVLAGISVAMLAIRFFLVRTTGAFWIWNVFFVALAVAETIMFHIFFKNVPRSYNDAEVLSMTALSVHIMGLISLSITLQLYSSGLAIWWFTIPLGFALGLIPLGFIDTLDIDELGVPAIGATVGLIGMTVFHFLRHIRVINIPAAQFYWVWAIFFIAFGVSSPLLIHKAFDETKWTFAPAIFAGAYFAAFSVPFLLNEVGFRWWWAMWIIDAAIVFVILSWVLDIDEEICLGTAVVLLIADVIALVIVHLNNFNELYTDLKGLSFFPAIGGFFKNIGALVMSLLAGIGLFFFQIIGGGFWSADFMGGIAGYGGLFNMIFIAVLIVVVNNLYRFFTY